MEAAHLARVRILYKTIMKLHKGLPGELKILGNEYAREEFKKHKTCNPAETAEFMIEWSKYAVALSEQLGLRGIRSGSRIGDNLTEDKLEDMTDEQIVQLYELMQASLGTEDDKLTDQDVTHKNRTQ